MITATTAHCCVVILVNLKSVKSLKYRRVFATFYLIAFRNVSNMHIEIRRRQLFNSTARQEICILLVCIESKLSIYLRLLGCF